MAIHGYKGGVISATAPTTSVSGASGVWTTDDALQAGANWPVAPALSTNSVRIRASATAYLSRTFPTAGNRKTWTWSGWVKRGTIGTAYERIFGGPANASHIYFVSDYLQFDLSDVASGTAIGAIKSSAVYRDPSAWYHIVAVCDTTQATSSNRMKLYVNGTQITALSQADYPSQNYESAINSAGQHTIGYRTSTQGSAGIPYDGYITEVNFIDGQALTPNYFGAIDAATGVWQPATYRGSYGTNGFYLPFTNITSTSTLGNDFSGNGNNWTANNISLTAGATYDSMTDVPTLTSATAANYCVLNPLNVDTTTLSNANLTASITGSSGGSSYFSTMAIPPSTKIYAEITITSIGDATELGITSDTSSPLNAKNNGIFYYFNGDKEVLGSFSAYGASYTANDVIGVAIDTSAGTIQFFKNNTSQGTITNSVISQNTMFLACVYYSSSTSFTGVHNWNFGQRPFAYTPPTGFVALNTFNLPTPTIGATASTQANKFFDATLWTGTGATLSVTNSGSMQPDLVWAKTRSAVSSNLLYDSIRGVNQFLSSNQTAAEATLANSLTAFNSNGFTVGSDSNINGNGVTNVAWQWRASNTTAVTNTAGSITSTVSANTSSGFSIVTYAGTNSNATVGHGLGVAPRMIIVKNRSGAVNWVVYHASIGNTGALYLNSTGGTDVASSLWNNTSPTSSVFSIGTGYSGTNNSGSNYVAYCFAEVAGFSRFGSYTGNNSSDGPFIYTGFRPRYVMTKLSSSSGGDWAIIDTARDTYNIANTQLWANSTSGDNSTVNCIDILSNGFKVRASGITNFNASGGTYIFMAFAESPFKYANAR